MVRQTAIYECIITKDSRTIKVPPLSQSLRLTPIIAPFAKETLDDLQINVSDFEAMWQNDAGSATVLHAPDSNYFLVSECVHFG